MFLGVIGGNDLPLSSSSVFSLVSAIKIPLLLGVIGGKEKSAMSRSSAAWIDLCSRSKRFRRLKGAVDARRRIHLSTKDENGNFVARFDSVEYFSRFKLEGRLKFEDERYIYL